MQPRYSLNNRILFIIKKRENPALGYATTMESGLRNSVCFVSDMLQANGVSAHMEEVVDNNDIDRVVTAFKPTICVIEAFWVVPDKFDQLIKLHPTVTWIVRGHSEMPFLASEGIAVGWIIEYARRHNIILAGNTPGSRKDILSILKSSMPALCDAALEPKVLYLPNYYPVASSAFAIRDHGAVANIGCFGAIRYLKNHLIQAIAALRLAEIIKVPVHFHINATRVEGQAEQVLKNLRNLFASAPYGMLIEHDWMPRDEFLNVLQTMDVSMQVSLSETFNIVTADAVSVGTPVVVSSEVYWLDHGFRVNPTSCEDILRGLVRAWNFDDLDLAHQSRCLNAYSSQVVAHWMGMFR